MISLPADNLSELLSASSRRHPHALAVTDGRLAAVRWASRTYPRLEYVTETVGGATRLARVRQCRASQVCADVYAVEYDPSGFVAAIADRAGRRAEFVHDASGRLRRARDPLDVEMGWPGRVYEGASQLRAVTSSEGERIEYEIAPVTRRVVSVRQVGPPDRVHRFEYGCDLPLGSLTAPDVWTHHIDPAGHRTVYRYDRWRRLRIVELPGGGEIHRGWSGYELARLVHPDGTDVRFEYAAADEVIRHDAPMPVPLAPPEVRGLINLRGEIATVVDVARRLGREPAPLGGGIGLVVRTARGTVTLFADRAGDVVDAEDADFEPPPETLKGPARDLVKGTYKIGDALVLLLDPARILG